ncbi:MAG: type module-associated protein Cmr5 [Pseudomonadota bacterium]|jgi:CRISPR-associated protein Cmr5
MTALTLKKPAQPRQTLEQRRAQHAWDKAGEGFARHGKDYINDAKGLPALIINSGLMQVMAFLHAKADRHETLASHLRDWLAVQCGTPRDFEGFMETLMRVDEPADYQAITAEAFAWLRLLRQMAPARQP